MSNQTQIENTRRSPRVIFFGMQGNFSAPILVALLESGVEICAVVVPAPPLPGREPPVIQRKDPSRYTRTLVPLALANGSTTPSISQLAWSRGIPVWEVRHLAHASVSETFAAYRPDIICVACFSLRIPRAILALPHLGCLNVHPALLPVNRGPVPLFWTFREGHQTTGVTIHLMDEGLDTGDIIAQEALPVPEGISYDQLNALCSTLGGILLARSVWRLYEGSAISRPQDEAKSSYHSFPTHDDFVVYADTWSAQHAYNFIRGVGNWDEPIELHAGRDILFVRDAISYAAERNDDGVWVRCSDGWLQAVLGFLNGTI